MALLDLSNIKTAGMKPEAIKPGEYQASVVEAKVNETRAKTGQYINMKLVLTSGDFEGRSIYHRFNIKNPNAKAEQIGLGELKGFMACAGMDTNSLQSVTDLEGKRVTVATGIKQEESGEFPYIKYFDKPAIIQKAEEV